MDWKKRTGNHKFWACITAVIIFVVASTNVTPKTMKRTVALIGAIDGLSIYTLSEGLTGSRPVDVKMGTKETVEEEEI